MANVFDKLCIVIAIPLGAILMILGALGLILGCNAHFTLPPLLGVIPFFPGFAMCVCLIKYWKLTNELQNKIAKQTATPSTPQSDFDQNL
ncbi:hypothetical protein JD969_10325 [Planctomycetota bacterium]|nr:hypothetical protein JD969_10325 [Planctomycetota bacterium]